VAAMPARTPVAPAGRWRRALRPVVQWLDSWTGWESCPHDGPQRVDWPRIAPLVALHVGCLGVLLVGWSPFAVGLALALYVVRMFFVTAFFHRYFSHRSFAASRAVQLLMAIATGTCVQRGPLWWAAHHRLHHARSDGPEDVHSPRQHGFLWSQVGWLTSRANFPVQLDVVRDLARFPELRFLDRFDTLVPVALAAALFGLGELLAHAAPSLGTDGPQLLVWGFFVSTTALLHGTMTINSLAHGFGRRRYATRDDSRNSLVLALLTLGEGWHNNHHHYPAAARQGFYWWELDPTYYGLLLLERLGIIRDLAPVPRHAREAWREPGRGRRAA